MNTQWAIGVMQKCFVPPSTIDARKVDELTFKVASTYLSQAIDLKEITPEEIEKRIMTPVPKKVDVLEKPFNRGTIQ